MGICILTFSWIFGTDYYYYATAGGAKIWVIASSCLVKTPVIDKDISFAQWKKYLTSMQITQFVIDLLVIYFARESNHQSGIGMADSYTNSRTLAYFLSVFFWFYSTSITPGSPVMLTIFCDRVRHPALCPFD